MKVLMINNFLYPNGENEILDVVGQRHRVVRGYIVRKANLS